MLAQDLLSGWPVARWGGHRLVVAVSGGADSVALLLSLSELLPGSQLLVAHFNHHWRGRHSQADQLFVVQLARRLGLRCVTNASLGLAGGVSQSDFEMCGELATDGIKRSEQAARRARYAFLSSAAYRHGAGYVVTAHHADDRLETMLHNLLRGTGLTGAASIPATRWLDENLVLARPLLRASRAEILQFLAERQQAYRTDDSNSDIAYGRNYIRHQLLPAMRARYPAADENLLKFSFLVEEAVADWERLADQWLDQVQRRLAQLRPSPAERERLRGYEKANWFVFPTELARAQVWSVVQSALRRLWLGRSWPQADMSMHHWQAIGQWLYGLKLSPPGEASPSQAWSRERLNLPGGIALEGDQQWTAIGPAADLARVRASLAAGNWGREPRQ